MFFYLHEFDHSSPKKTEASKLTANHVGLSSKKRKQSKIYSIWNSPGALKTDGSTNAK